MDIEIKIGSILTKGYFRSINGNGVGIQYTYYLLAKISLFMDYKMKH